MEFALEKRSYKTEASERIRLLYFELQTILYNATINSYNEPNKVKLINNYIKWMNYIIKKQKEVMEFMFKMRRRKEGSSLIKQKQYEFCLEIEYGIFNFNQLTNENQLPYGLFYYEGNIMNELKASPILINNMLPSELLESLIKIYTTLMDPYSFWLTKEDLLRVLKNSNKSLLKLMLFQTFNKIIKFNDQQFIEVLKREGNGFNQILRQSMDTPSLENLTGLTLLSFEYFFEQQRATARLYILHLIEMKKQVEEQNLEKLSKSNQLWKQRIFEIIELLAVFLEIKNEFESDYKLNYRLKHINRTVLCIPTKPRELKQNVIIIDNIHDFLNNNNNPIYTNPTYNDDEQANYYAFATWCELQACDYINYYRTKLIRNEKNEIQNSNTIFKLTKHKVNLINQIDMKLQNTPKEYKQYQLINQEQAYEIRYHGKLKFSDSSFSSYAYYVILISKLTILNPLIGLLEQPYQLSNKKHSYKLYEGTINIWKYLNSCIKLNIKNDQIHYPIINNSSHFLTIIYFSLNILINDLFNKKDRIVIYNYLVKFIEFLKLSEKSDVGFLDANFTLSRIRAYLNQFKLPDKYPLSL
ncbi:hypothetical protein K502DRAFT_351612 [Neoconidiobolus thromboides FSU 785]|nr:hypothetical protein K502DRAFT_351612 [Neoconidiobolus thromboides FSU 785]